MKRAHWAYIVGKYTRRYSPFAARFIVILYLLAGLTPAPPRILPEPPHIVETDHPVLCMHTRLSDEVEDWKIQRTLQLVREMGASTIVEFFYWAYIQPAEHVYQWHHADRIMSAARQQGLQIIARLGVVPAWARPEPREKETSHNYLTPDRYKDYTQFVREFAARYKDQVIGIIPWNEPNLTGEWGYQGVIGPEKYIEFLRPIYESVHSVAPGMLVIGGALAPTIEPPGSPVAYNDIDYLRRIYEIGGDQYFDALAVHTYGFTVPPEADPQPDTLNFRRFELLQQIMDQYGDGSKPVYITETNWNDHPRWRKAVSPGQRVQYTVNSIKFVEREWPNVKNLCFYFFRYPVLFRNYNDYFSFVTPEFRLKPIYTAVQAYARGFDETP
jgi:polysaccharide biosynthesis protein PslG